MRQSQYQEEPIPTIDRNQSYRTTRTHTLRHMRTVPQILWRISLFHPIIHDTSRYTFIYFLSHKDHALSAFLEFQALVERFTGKQIKILRCDNAKEFTRGQFEERTLKVGLKYEPSAPYSPSQNGVAERANYTVERMMRAMLMDGNMSDFFWTFAARNAIHLKNRLPHSALPKDTTPFFYWFKRQPDISHIHQFGVEITARIGLEKPPK